MKINRGVNGADRLPPAYQRAADMRADLGRALGLYALGDRSEVVLEMLAFAKAAYDAVGTQVPVPRGVDPALWPGILNILRHRYGFRAYVNAPHALSPSDQANPQERAPGRPLLWKSRSPKAALNQPTRTTTG